MNTETTWDIEGHKLRYDPQNDVLWIELIGELSPDAFVKVDQRTDQVFADRLPKVVWCVREHTGSIPKEMRDSIKEKLLDKSVQSQRKQGYSAIVGASPAMRIAVKVLSVFSRDLAIKFCKDNDEALAYLKGVK